MSREVKALIKHHPIRLSLGMAINMGGLLVLLSLL